MKGMSQSQYAKHRTEVLGQPCTQPAVAAAIRTGRIRGAILPDTSIDPEEADRLWALNTRGATLDRAPSVEGAEDYNASRARHEKAKADLAEIKLAEGRGDLVRRKAIADALFASARQARDRLMAVAARAAPLVAASSDTAECARILSDEIQAALEDLVPEALRDA